MTTFAVRNSIGIANDTVTVFNISQDGTANTALNPVTVPAGKVWIVKHAAVVQSDATARAVAIQIVDASDNVIATIAGDLVTTGITGITTRYSGHFIVVGGYKVRGNTVGITASTPAIQISGLEFNQGLDSRVLGLN
jgi:hypothetical protein